MPTTDKLAEERSEPECTCMDIPCRCPLGGDPDFDMGKTHAEPSKLAEAKKLIEDSKKNAKECSSENCWHTRICEHKFLLMLQPYLEAQDLISRENQRKFDSEIDFGDVQINESIAELILNPPQKNEDPF